MHCINRYKSIFQYGLITWRYRADNAIRHLKILKNQLVSIYLNQCFSTFLPPWNTSIIFCRTWTTTILRKLGVLFYSLTRHTLNQLKKKSVFFILHYILLFFYYYFYYRILYLNYSWKNSNQQ